MKLILEFNDCGDSVQIKHDIVDCGGEDEATMDLMTMVRYAVLYAADILMEMGPDNIMEDFDSDFQDHIMLSMLSSAAMYMEQTGDVKKASMFLPPMFRKAFIESQEED